MPENETTQNEKPQDGLALIIGGLFVLALVFAAYNYFKQSKDNTVTTDNSISQSTTDNSKGDVNGNGAKDEKITNDKNTTDTSTQQNQDVTLSTTSSTWVANDYKKGDIVGASYTVKSGDTLWEIAEAAYGDGTQWTKILEANKANVGYLPNGSQALIIPGQVLVLP
jgi:5'-nucleotidase / UDP-sugar diphosphatase